MLKPDFQPEEIKIPMLARDDEKTIFGERKSCRTNSSPDLDQNRSLPTINVILILLGLLSILFIVSRKVGYFHCWLQFFPSRWPRWWWWWRGTSWTQRTWQDQRWVSWSVSMPSLPAPPSFCSGAGAPPAAAGMSSERSIFSMEAACSSPCCWSVLNC